MGFERSVIARIADLFAAEVIPALRRSGLGQARLVEFLFLARYHLTIEIGDMIDGTRPTIINRRLAQAGNATGDSISVFSGMSCALARVRPEGGG